MHYMHRMSATQLGCQMGLGRCQSAKSLAAMCAFERRQSPQLGPSVLVVRQTAQPACLLVTSSGRLMPCKTPAGPASRFNGVAPAAAVQNAGCLLAFLHQVLGILFLAVLLRSARRSTRVRPSFAADQLLLQRLHQRLASQLHGTPRLSLPCQSAPLPAPSHTLSTP